jgi:hypothetical protein
VVLLLETHFDLIMVILGYFLAFMVGQYYGERREDYLFNIARLARPLVVPKPLPLQNGVKPPLPVFEELKVEQRADDYLGV